MVGVQGGRRVKESPVELLKELGGSSAKCIIHTNNDMHHTCLLRNICLDRRKNIHFRDKIVLSYLDGPGEEPLGGGSISHLHQHKIYFPSSPTKNTWVTTAALDGRIPYISLHAMNVFSNTSQSAPTYYFPRKVVLVDAMNSFNVANYGHAFMDYIFSAFVGARKLNHNISNFLFFPINMRRDTSTDNNFKKFQRYLTLVNATANVRLAKYDKNSCLCFAELLVPGYHGLYRDSSYAVTHYSRALRDYIFDVFPVESTNISPKIIFSYKKKPTSSKKLFAANGRNLLNVADIEKSLKKYFGDNAIALYDFGELLLSQQISLLRSAKVFVSPLGGGSLSAFLLSDNAVFLQIDSFNFDTNQSECLIVYECRLYKSLKHIIVLRHPINSNEMTNTLLNTSYTPPNRGLYMKLMGDFKLDVTTLTGSIEKGMGLANSGTDGYYNDRKGTWSSSHRVLLGNANYFYALTWMCFVLFMKLVQSKLR